MTIKHREPYQWSYKRDAAALRAEARVWAEVETAKGDLSACDAQAEETTAYDLLVEYESHCRRQERRGCAPAGFCSWCHKKLHPPVLDVEDEDIPLVPGTARARGMRTRN